MKYLRDLSQKELTILINEFIVSIEDLTKDNLPIELLKFLRKKNIKTENTEVFQALHDKVEKKIL